MRNRAEVIHLVGVFLALVFISSALAQQPAEPQIHPLHSKRHEVLRMSGIMRDLATEMGESRNARISRDMHHLAERGAEYLESIQALLKLYESLNTDRERRLALGTLYLRLLIYLDKFDARIREVSEGLADASDGPMKAELAKEGLRLLQRLSEARNMVKDLEVEMKVRLNKT